MSINYREWKNQARYYGAREAEDPNWQRRVHSMMVHTNLLPKRRGRSPMFFNNFKNGINPTDSDLLNLDDVPLNLGSNDNELQVDPLGKDEKRKSPKKDGKDGKGDFDSNSYFMLRPLRREPSEMYETPIMQELLGKDKSFNFCSFITILRTLCLCVIYLLISGKEPIRSVFRYRG